MSVRPGEAHRREPWPRVHTPLKGNHSHDPLTAIHLCTWTYMEILKKSKPSLAWEKCLLVAYSHCNSESAFTIENLKINFVENKKCYYNTKTF